MTFSFVQITDHHLTKSDAELLIGFSTRHAFRSTLQHIARNTGINADFLVSTGDLVDEAGDASYAAALALLEAEPSTAEFPGPLRINAAGFKDFPFYVMPGNHDDRRTFLKSLYPRSAAGGPANAAFTHKGVQFIILDWGPGGRGFASPEMLDFLARRLDGELPSVILMHHQLVKIGSRWLDAFLPQDTGQFWSALAGRRVLGIFCGHIHTTYEEIVHGVPVYGLRSTSYPFVLQDEPLACLLPPHYRVVTITDGVLNTEVVEVPL